MGVVVGAAFIAGVVGRIMYKKNADKRLMNSNEERSLKPLRTGWRKEYSGTLPMSSTAQHTSRAIIQSLQDIGVVRDLKESADTIEACIEVAPRKLCLAYCFYTKDNQAVHYTVSSRSLLCSTMHIHNTNAKMVSSYMMLSGTE